MFFTSQRYEHLPKSGITGSVAVIYQQVLDSYLYLRQKAGESISSSESSKSSGVVVSTMATTNTADSGGRSSSSSGGGDGSDNSNFCRNEAVDEIDEKLAAMTRALICDLRLSVISLSRMYHLVDRSFPTAHLFANLLVIERFCNSSSRATVGKREGTSSNDSDDSGDDVVLPLLVFSNRPTIIGNDTQEITPSVLTTLFQSLFEIVEKSPVPSEFPHSLWLFSFTYFSSHHLRIYVDDYSKENGRALIKVFNSLYYALIRGKLKQERRPQEGCCIKNYDYTVEVLDRARIFWETYESKVLCET